jgi:hypothetical protein
MIRVVAGPVPVLVPVLVLVLVLVLVPMPVAHAQSPGKPLPFSCATFPPDISEADLRGRFGEKNVEAGLVEWGGAEGDLNPGTILFGDSEDGRLEIYWSDIGAKRRPEWISVRSWEHGTRWRTPAGITLRTDLRTIERLNRRPFRLVGFDFDYGGTVLGWSGGQLEKESVPPCRVRVRMSPGELARDQARINAQVSGDREFSSGHPAMQALNPAVYELFLTYR